MDLDLLTEQEVSPWLSFEDHRRAERPRGPFDRGAG